MDNTKKTSSSISAFDLENAISILDIVRKEAVSDLEYGFDDDWVGFMKKMRILTNQSSGARMQNYIFRAFGWEKIPANLNRGDVRNSLGQYYEVKVTTITTSNTCANIVQIRPWQKTSGYHVFVIDSTKNYKLTHFSLSKQEMSEEIELCASHAHGTKETNKENQNIEWCIRIPWEVGCEIYDRWMEKYRQDTNIDKQKA